MGRILAFDYGKKRIGIAVTDPLQMIANGLDTVSPNVIFKFIEDYLAKETVDTFVVGLPKTVKNEASESMKYIEPFVKGLKNKYPNIPVEMYDERFTSVLAHQAMIVGGVKKKERRENKELVDKVSATIILQSYLESRRFKNELL
ncbi:MAG: Holliday junction resolvase RuvX [Paludibacteraceae bacterium]|nr:Holliday junction resolvase RuvX [Paludibacteraceae bacterium]